jgi:hypothetical protein
MKLHREDIVQPDNIPVEPVEHFPAPWPAPPDPFRPSPAPTMHIGAPECMRLLERLDSIPLSRLYITYKQGSFLTPTGWTVNWKLENGEEGTSIAVSLDGALRRALAAIDLARGKRDGEEAART